MLLVQKKFAALRREKIGGLVLTLSKEQLWSRAVFLI